MPLSRSIALSLSTLSSTECCVDLLMIPLRGAAEVEIAGILASRFVSVFLGRGRCVVTNLAAERDAPANNCSHGRAAERVPVERSIARFARRFGGAESPFVSG